MYNGTLGTVSNREDWIQAVDVVDENGDDVTITSATISMAIRKKGESSPSLEASVGDGITVATPRFTWSFDAEDMDELDAGQYEVGITVTISGTTTQLMVATVNIIDGIVS